MNTVGNMRTSVDTCKFVSLRRFEVWLRAANGYPVFEYRSRLRIAAPIKRKKDTVPLDIITVVAINFTYRKNILYSDRRLAWASPSLFFFSLPLVNRVGWQFVYEEIKIYLCKCELILNYWFMSVYGKNTKIETYECQVERDGCFLLPVRMRDYICAFVQTCAFIVI